VKSKVLLKRVGVGAVIVACAAFTTFRYLDEWAPPAETMELLNAEMDRVQQQMQAWGGADWSSRSSGDREVSQTWFIKVPNQSDRELANEIYALGGYDNLSGLKGDLHMTVAISSAPSSEWRIAHVEIAEAR